MAGGDGKPKQPPKAPPLGPRPVQVARATPRGTSDSLFDLAPVGGTRTRTVTNVPRANPFGSEEKTSTSMSNLPRVAGPSSNNLRPVGPSPLVQPPRRKSNVIQKRMASSGFDQEERTQLDVVLGRTKSVELDLDEPTTNTIEFYDGEQPAPEVTDQETWRAVQPPVQSRPRRRAARLLWTVIDQFACGHNPRYAVNSPAAEPRAHVFAWDVSLAMDCEIAHNRGGRELSLAQTIDWVRFECVGRGWVKVDQKNALAAAERGELVLIISKDPKQRALALLRPGGVGDDGQPRVASAGRPRGNDLGLLEALGPAVDYFAHF